MSDTTAPVLLGLTLPSSIDLSSGTAVVEVGVRTQDEAGGSSIRSVTIEFDDRFWLDNSTGASTCSRSTMSASATISLTLRPTALPAFFGSAT